YRSRLGGASASRGRRLLDVISPARGRGQIQDAKGEHRDAATHQETLHVHKIPRSGGYLFSFTERLPMFYISASGGHAKNEESLKTCAFESKKEQRVLRRFASWFRQALKIDGRGWRLLLERILFLRLAEIRRLPPKICLSQYESIPELCAGIE